MAGVDARGDRPGHREIPRPEIERVATPATLLTFARTAVAVALALAAAHERSLALLLWSLAAYWVGDVADGELARRLDVETRTGAVLDILCDRFCAACLYLGIAWYDSGTIVPVGLYLGEFLVVDMFLSLAFLAWPVNSPNYFYVVDERIWRWNWSKPAKAVNSSAFAILLIATRNPWLTSAVALALVTLKVISLRWLLALRVPIPAAPLERRG